MPENTTQEVSQTVVEQRSIEERYPMTGTYKGIMTQVKSMLQRLTTNDETAAHMAGHACGCEFGRLVSQRKSVGMDDIKVGKISKDGLVTVTEAASKFKGVYLTNGLMLIKILAACKDVEKLGAEIERLTLPSSVQSWIESLGK